MVTGHYGGFDQLYWASLSRFLHVISGVMWIGLLYYFNFVQIPNMPNIPDEQKPAIGKVIAPAALFWYMEFAGPVVQPGRANSSGNAGT